MSAVATEMSADGRIIADRMAKAERVWKEYVEPYCQPWRGEWGRSRTEFGFHLPVAFIRPDGLTEDEFVHIREAAAKVVRREFKKVYTARAQTEAEQFLVRVRHLQESTTSAPPATAVTDSPQGQAGS